MTGTYSTANGAGTKDRRSLVRFCSILIFLLVAGLNCAVEDNPFLQKISQKALEPRTSGSGELRILQVGVDLIATLSKSDMLKLMPDSYGGDLQGSWGESSSLNDAGETGTGTYLNAEFKLLPIGSTYETGEPGPDGENGAGCDTENSCNIAPREDSVFVMYFDITKEGGLLQNALAFIKNNPQDTEPKQQLQDLLLMTPANLPIQDIPTLGTVYNVLLTIVDVIGSIFGIDDAAATIDNMIRQGVADTYGIGLNQEVVSPGFVQEAIVRNVIYPVADGEVVSDSDLTSTDKANKRRLLVFCEEDSNCYANGSCAQHGGDISTFPAPQVSHCSNTGGLRRGPRGGQYLPVPPHEALQLGGGGPDYRDPNLYSPTQVSIPIFLGDALADMKTLAVKDYKTLMDLEIGNISQSSAGTPRYSFLEPSFESVGGATTVSSPTTEIMFNESTETPDPAPGEFNLKLPVKVPGIALDGYDFSSATYAGEDSLTEDGILIYIGDRAAFNKCFPNQSGQKMSIIGGDDSNENTRAGCVESGGSTDPTGAGMVMNNVEEDPKMSFDFNMRADQVIKTIYAAIHYQYKDKILCIGWTVYTECDFGIAIEMEPMTQDIVTNFYTAADMTFSIDNIDVGIDRTQIAASMKGTFNGFTADGKPVVDIGDFQSVLPCNNGEPGCYYCDPLTPGWPDVCYQACLNENPDWIKTDFNDPDAGTYLCRNLVEFGDNVQDWLGEATSDPAGGLGDAFYDTDDDQYRYHDGGAWGDMYLVQYDLDEDERLAKAAAQKPLRRISDELFDNTVGEPNIYSDLLFINTNQSDPEEVDGQEGLGQPVLFWKIQGVVEKSGFYMDPFLTQSICAEEFKFENCVTADKLFGSATGDGSGDNWELGTKEGDKAAAYVNDNTALVVNNLTKTVYTQDETGNIYKLTIYKNSNPRKVSFDWERL